MPASLRLPLLKLAALRFLGRCWSSWLAISPSPPHLTRAASLQPAWFSGAQLSLGEILSERQGSFSSSFTVCRSDLSGPLIRTAPANATSFSQRSESPAGRKSSSVVRLTLPTQSTPWRSTSLSTCRIPTSLYFPIARAPIGTTSRRPSFLPAAIQSGLPPAFNQPSQVIPFILVAQPNSFLLARVCPGPDVVKTLGRWSSAAFLKYWWSLDRIAPRHVELLPPTL